MDNDKKTTASTPLLYAEIKKGLKVIDDDGDKGVIADCEDAHNIIVNYANGGRGLHCLVDGCEEFGISKLYARKKIIISRPPKVTPNKQSK